MLPKPCSLAVNRWYGLPNLPNTHSNAAALHRSILCFHNLFSSFPVAHHRASGIWPRYGLTTITQDTNRWVVHLAATTTTAEQRTGRCIGHPMVKSSVSAKQTVSALSLS